MGSDAHIGDVMLWPGKFVPKNYLPCDGSLLSISAYQKLYRVIGTTYGGDGATTFALPDLRGRAPVGLSREDPRFTIGATGGAAKISGTPVPTGTGAPVVRIPVMESGLNSFDNRSPYLVLMFCICYQGYVPSPR